MGSSLRFETLSGGAGRPGGTQEAEVLTQEETAAADLEDFAVVFAKLDDRVGPAINATATGSFAKGEDDLFWVFFAHLAEFGFTLLGRGGFFRFGAEFVVILNFRAHE
ncbi:MAG: hypothetical protein L0196_09715 [candidate division Zixibacteria bacterium]|nr:hypothetical protein [candidate division Zixibacteria bacterium]